MLTHLFHRVFDEKSYSSGLLVINEIVRNLVSFQQHACFTQVAASVELTVLAILVRLCLFGLENCTCGYVGLCAL